jgi:hypothetical protein
LGGEEGLTFGLGLFFVVVFLLEFLQYTALEYGAVPTNPIPVAAFAGTDAGAAADILVTNFAPGVFLQRTPVALGSKC